jgi:hypothetical protein
MNAFINYSLINAGAIFVFIKSPTKIRLATNPLGDISVFDDNNENNPFIL